MMFLDRAVMCLTVCLLSSTADMVCAQANDAATDVAPDAAIDYLVLSQPLPDMLDMMARDAGLRFDVSAAVRGRVVQRRLTGTVPKILARIAGENDLDWFLFNGIYFVSARSEATTRLTRLGDLSPDDAKAALTAAGLMSAGYSVEEAAEGTAIAISGPPKYLAFAEALIESIPSTPKVERPDLARTVTVRRGVEAEKVAVE